VQVLRFCPVDLPLTLVYYVTAGKLYIHDHAKPKAPMRLIPIESDACVMRFEQEGEKPDLLVATYRNNTITLLQ
jgi:hypothetical protein